MFVAIFVLSMLYASWDKENWDDFSKEHARFIVKKLDKLSKEQFLEYWGDNPPGTPEQREQLFAYASTFGELVTIKDINLVQYRSHVSFTGNGVTHLYIYDVHTEFTNGPVVFRLWLRANGDKLDVLNLTLNNV